MLTDAPDGACVMAADAPLDALREQVKRLLPRAHVPFSETPDAALLLLKDGTWVPGVRVESASFSLTIPAVLNAYTTLAAAERTGDIVAVAVAKSPSDGDRQYLAQLPDGPFTRVADDVFVREGISEHQLPSLDAPMNPFVDGSLHTPREGIELARAVSERAYVPASSFPVGAVLELDDGRLVPGVNVEHPDWARILCAERNAIGTVQSYGLGPPERLYLSCLEAADGTPCGACRQVLSELAPDLRLWMDRGSNDPEEQTPRALLPGSFQGAALLRTS